MMEQLPSLDQLTERHKDPLIQPLWTEVQARKAKVAEAGLRLCHGGRGLGLCPGDEAGVVAGLCHPPTPGMASGIHNVSIPM